MTDVRHSRPPPILRSFRAGDLPALVTFWNQAFAGQRNFRPLTAAEFQTRVIDCPAFDPAGLILAWSEAGEGPPRLIGLAHAFRPAPQTPVYRQWGKHHSLALLYVTPEFRQQGVGSALLRAAEKWLYYCPIVVGHLLQPCYGTVEGPRPPLFGSTQHMGIDAQGLGLVHFLAHRGYIVVEPGDVSLVLDPLPARPSPRPVDWSQVGLHLWPIDQQSPFVGEEPPGREQYTLWGPCDDTPYAGYVLVDASGVLHGHISWYPMARPGWAALLSFWVAPPLRGKGLGSALFDLALAEMAQAPGPRGGYQAVEVQTHLVRHSHAAELYQRRGFVADAAWVQLVKT